MYTYTKHINRGKKRAYMSRDDETKVGIIVATLIGVNAMIGAGVMALPALVAKTAGPAGILSFLLSTVCGIFLGLSLARLAIIHPGKAWNYLYPSLWGGHTCGMLSASCYLFGIIIAMGFLVQQAGIWLHPFIPMIEPQSLGIITLALLTLLVLAGAHVSSWGQYIIASCVVVPLLITTIVCWSHFSFEAITPFMPFGTASIFSAASLTLFSFFGFESISSLYSSLQNPSRTIMYATILSISIVGFIYMIFTAGILFSVPLSCFSAGVNEPLSIVVKRAFPQYTFLPALILVAGLFAIIGTLHSMIWSVGNLFFDVISRVRTRFIIKLLNAKVITNSRIVIVTSVFMGLSSLVHAEQLIKLAVVLVIITYLLAIIYLLFQKKEWESGFNFITVSACISGIILLYHAGLPLLVEMMKIIKVNV